LKASVKPSLPQAEHVVLPELPADVVTVDASFGTLHGSYWLCANLATRQPLLLVVNDAQWADETSLRFVGVLARRLDALRRSCCSRSAQGRRSRLAELAADPRTELLVRRPLSSAAVGALLGEWSPAGVDAEFALACEAATRGNPFLLSRLAHGLREHGIAVHRRTCRRGDGRRCRCSASRGRGHPGPGCVGRCRASGRGRNEIAPGAELR
jgi:hypothetical protein